MSTDPPPRALASALAVVALVGLVACASSPSSSGRPRPTPNGDGDAASAADTAAPVDVAGSPDVAPDGPSDTPEDGGAPPPADVPEDVAPDVPEPPADALADGADGAAADGADGADGGAGCANDEECAEELGALPGCRTARCDPETGGCVAAPVADGTACDDGDACSDGDACAEGACVPGAAVVCDDGDACDGVETCDPEVGCRPGVPPECDDGDPCNGAETCAASVGCVAGPAPVCDDDEPCTDDSCVAFVGCHHAPRVGACEDGDPCTEGDRCVDGVCDAGPDTCLCPEDDIYEENDAAALATLVPVEPAYPSVTTFLGAACEGDVDWYRIDLLAGDTLAVVLAHDPNRGPVALRVETPAGEPLTVLPEGLPEVSASITVEEATPVLLRVEGGVDGAVGNAYRLDVRYVPSVVCAPDPLEEDDLPAFATWVAPGSALVADACPYDMDWFVVTPTQPATVVIDVYQDDPQRVVELDLYDASLERVATGTQTGRIVRAWHPMDGAGALYARVFTAGLLHVEYTLSATLEPLAVCVDDAFGENDLQDGAPPLAVGATATARICPGDRDWFTVSLAAGEQIAATLEHPPDAGVLELSLHAPSVEGAEGERLTGSFTAVGEASVNAVATVDGPYGVRVGGAVDEGVTYRLSLSGDAAWDCAADPCEEDDTAELACVLTADQPREATRCAGDDDWFSFQVVNPGVDARLTLQRTGGDGELVAELYGPGGSLLGTATTVEGAANLVAVTPSAGRHTVRITGVTDSAQAGYVATLSLTTGGPDCSDDLLEPNDEPLAPAAVELQSDYILRLCPGDEDWFAVDTDARGVVRAVVVPSPGGVVPEVSVHDAAGTLLATGASDAGAIRAAHIALVPGRHLVRVAAPDASTATSYQLLVRVDPWQCEEDGWEPNDGIEDAPLLTPPVTFEAAVCGGDPDWYAVALETGDELTATLDFLHDAGDLNLYLTRANGQTLDFSGSSDDGEQIVWTATASGVYGLRVFGLSGASNLYTFDVAVLRAAPPCDDDEYEENDTEGTATGIAAGLSYLGQRCPDDDDWYAIDVAAGDTLVVDLAREEDAANLYVEVHHPGGMLASANEGEAAAKRVVTLAAQSGRHAIRVHAPDPRAVVPYTLVAHVLDGGSGECIDDAFEENDEPQAASSMPAGDTLVAHACPDDPDWFVAALPGLRTLTASLEHGGVGTLTLSALDPYGELLGEVEAEAGAPGTLEVDALAVGEHLLLVESDAHETDYRLSLSTRAWECVDDAYEPNDAIESAVDVTGTPSVSAVVCEGDPDWYVVALDAGDTVTVDLRFRTAIGNLNLYLTRENGQTLVFGGSVDDDEHITYTATEAGLYGIRVFGLMGASNVYTLEVGVTPGR